MWRFLVPGLRIKRFLVIIALGFVAIGVAFGRWLLPDPMSLSTGAVMFAVGVLIVAGASWGLSKTVGDVLGSDKWAGVLYSRRQLARGPKIVALGGGTGLPVVLRGLKNYTSNLTAVVTVADDGGSSGRLRGDLGVLPPGDIRNCMVALADTEPLMEELFQHRFQSGELKGHSFGNLFLAAMEQTAGDFVTALRESSRVLAVRGTVLPATLEKVTLWAELETGEKIWGESKIGRSPARIRRLGMEPEDATPLAEAVQAIMEADMVVLGPGSLYTSVIPNLLVRPIQEAIRHTPAVRVYVANVMTQPGETTHYTVRDHLDALERQVGRGLVDVVLVNNQKVDDEVLARYRKEGAEPVLPFEGGASAWPEVVASPLITADGVVRHDPQKLARALLKLLVRYRPHWSEGRILDGLWLEARLRERKRGA
ncbi:gluconeogenesis factor YvcK family protein [Sulfobacillus harzensis]|uniref:Putative gluconeogenesis factor n=1 Tax=Sulfobacillus harzensis TaxID=2729629 RepID=A0A7Y0Q208_9FIRM|nr:YvcK family protein [Sulfobacillus harzensis]NMP22668.1 YvcK family protein [Sulfobacillus harzensis]